MKRISIFLVCLSFLMSWGMKAQTVYDVNQMTNDEFSNRGNQYWNFQVYTVATGIYNDFPLFGEDCGINYWDVYLPERYNNVLIGEPDPGNESKPQHAKVYADKREAWHIEIVNNEARENNRFVYIGRDAKWGFEAYSNMEYNSAFVFRVPATGYYKANVTVRREDCILTNLLQIKTRFRYGGESTVNYKSTMGFDFKYGEGGGVWNAEINFFEPQQPVSTEFYTYAKAGDMIAFEPDIQATSATGWTRDAWARTLFETLKMTEVSETEAKTSARFCDPYRTDALVELETLIDETYDFMNAINVGDECYLCYPQQYADAVNEALNAAGVAIESGIVNAMNSVVYMSQIRDAVAEMKKNQNMDDLATAYKFLDQTSEEFRDKTYRGGVWNYEAYNVATGTYTNFKNHSTASRAGSGLQVWCDSNNDWLFIAINGDVHCTTTISPAISFKAPKDGVYKAIASINRTVNNKNYSLYERFRFRLQGTNSVPKETTMGFDMAYGNMTIDPAESQFYVNMKAGDIITFEQEGYTANNIQNANSVWNKLYVIPKDDDEDAMASGKYFNPYITTPGDFTQLQALVNEANGIFGSAKEGEGLGNYPADSMDDFEYAIFLAQNMLNTGTANQIFIDAEITVLRAAINTFRNTMLSQLDEERPGFELPVGVYYIKSGDLYLTASETIVERKPVTLEPLIPGDEKNCQVWNIQYNADYKIPPRYTIVSTIKGNTWDDDGIGHIAEGGNFMDGNTAYAQSNTSTNQTWRNFEIHTDGSKYCLWNVNKQWSLNVTWDGTKTVIATPSDKKYYIYTLIPYPMSGQGINNPNAASGTVYGAKSAIVVNNANNGANVQVYNLTGTLLNTTVITGEQVSIPMNLQGIFIVKITDMSGTSATKVSVK